MRNHRLSFLLFTLSLILGVMACTLDLTMGDEAVPAATDTPASSASGSDDTLPLISSCPDADVWYRLDYIHEVIQNTPGAHFVHSVAPDAAFFLTIRGDGTIDSNEYENLITVSIIGTFEDCVLEGTGELSANIIGLCTEGIAALLITEQWESLTTTVTCPDREPQPVNIEGLFSAPEDRADYRLVDEGDTIVLETDYGILSAYYSWTLHEVGLALKPLP
jgi:hypothetical protein